MPPLGPPPDWLSPAAADAWEEFRRDIPWLQAPHSGLVAIAATLYGRLRTSAGTMGSGAMNLLRQCLAQMGATPTDAGKIMWSPPEDDPDDELFAV